MSRLSDASAVLDQVLLVSRQQLALRTASLAAAVGFLVLVQAAGGSPGWFPLLLLLLAAATAATLPDSNTPLVLVLGLGWLWWAQVPDAFSAWTPAAAVLLTVVHVTSTLGGYGPPALQVPGPLLLAWGRRAAVMAAAAALVWLTAGLLAALDLPPSAAVVVLGLAVVTAWIVLLIRRLVTGED